MAAVFTLFAPGVLLLFVPGGAPSALGQEVPTINNLTSTPLPGTGHDYIQMLAETVNPSNGSLSLRISLPVPEGRQMELPFAFAYDSNGVRLPGASPLGTTVVWKSANLVPTPLSLTAGGWSYMVPQLGWSDVLQFSPFSAACRVHSGFTFTDENGGRHNLGIASNSQCQGQGQSPNVTPGGDDLFQAQVIQAPSPAFLNTILVADASGKVYKFHDGCVFPDSMEDRNGNKIIFNGQCTANLQEIDTLGRTAIAISGFGNTGDTVQVAGIANPYVLTWDKIPASFSLNATLRPSLSTTEATCPSGFGQTSDTAPAISSVTLPNGHQFQFQYDPVYGLLNKIVYPGGGYVSYVWAPDPQAEFGIIDLQFDPQGTPGFSVSLPCAYTFDTVAIAKRLVSFDGVTIAEEQDFTYSTTFPATAFTCTSLSAPCGNWSGKTTTVTTRDLVSGTSFSTVYTYTSTTIPPPPYTLQMPSQIPLEQTVVVIDSNNKVLRTVNKVWIDQFELQSQQTTLDNGLTTQTVYSYGPGAQITEEDNFAYGNGTPGPLLRRKTTTYASFPPTPAYPGMPSIFNRPSQMVVYNGAGVAEARVVECYDQNPVTDTSASAFPQHDYKNHGASFNVRGNLTQTLGWLNPPGGSNPIPACGDPTSSSAVSTTYAYDDTGQLLNKTDALGNQTAYVYGPANAYLAATKSPIPDVNGKHGSSSSLVTSTVYDFNTGLLTSITDPDQNTTTFAYNDPLNRLTSITRPPGGGSTQIDYGDVAPYLFAHMLTEMDAGHSLESYKYVDGLGQEARKLQFDGTTGSPWVAIDTRYNGLGFIATVSNAHRITGPAPAPDPCSPSAPCTSTSYDALGRVRVVTTPDGQVTTTNYAGNVSTATDQAGIGKDLVMDSIGRLVQVTENPANLNNDGSPVTTYAYDARDNLLCVHQKGIDTTPDKACNDSTVAAAWRPRNFAYDSLSRLLTQTQPESGTVQYTYDALGNPLTFTDANGTTTMRTYDPLSRVLTVTHSDTTPGATNYYDGTGKPTPGSNPLRKLSFVVSSDLSLGSYSFDNYDTMGRVLGMTQTVDNIPYQTTYSYDLAGHLVQEGYPSGRIVRTTFDAAGRPSSVTAPTNALPYASRIQYAPHGDITDLMLGIGFWEHTVYDPQRLQPTQINVGTSQGGSDLLGLTYDYGATTGNNNGNVRRHMISAPGLAVTQLVLYDGFNRILKMQEVNKLNAVFPFQSTSIWEQDFTHDYWSNRTGLLSSGGGLLTAVAPAVDLNNRIDVTKDNRYVYDAAGFLKQEPVGTGVNDYTYDADGRMIQAQEGSSVQVLQYDGLGHRVKKMAGGATTVFLHDAHGRLIAEYSTATPSANGTRYLTPDIFGSERLVTGLDSSKNPVVIARYDFLPFGEVIPIGLGGRSSVGGYDIQGVTRQLFTGKERDQESGLDYFGARYYSSPQGRFTSVDPFDVVMGRQGAQDEQKAGSEFRHYLSQPQHWNRYAYALDNPLRYVDPDGLDVIVVGVSVVFDRYAHYTEEEKQQIIQAYLQELKATFASIDITFVVVSQSEGTATNLTNSNRSMSGATDNNLNVFFTKGKVSAKYESVDEVTNAANSSVFIRVDPKNNVGDKRDLAHGAIHALAISSPIGASDLTQFLNEVATSFTRHNLRNEGNIEGYEDDPNKRYMYSPSLPQLKRQPNINERLRDGARKLAIGNH